MTDASTPHAEPVAPTRAAEPVTMFVLHCPFRKTGSPVLGTMGATVRPVVLFDLAEWKRLCAEVPQLASTQFRVGTLE